MTDYITIQSYFKEILKESRAIKGRFYPGSRYGLQEINYDELGQLLDEVKVENKYPLVMMAPPSSNFSEKPNAAGWERYRIVLYFCTTSYYGVGKARIENTNTSSHTIQEDWHDMKRCAKAFLKQLDQLGRVARAIIRFPPNDVLVVPFSSVGIDRASGVHVHFDLDVWNNPCEITDDYDGPIKEINIDYDGHSEHTL